MIERRKPSWLRVKALNAGAYSETAARVSCKSLNTVCKEAGCPNIYECYGRGTATFMILGKTCTRSCTFCKVEKGEASQPDPEEPGKIAEACAEMGLDYVVITSVTRDDLPDGGAAHFAETIVALREAIPNVSVEVLIPDFGGNRGALRRVAEARPNVINHNIETVPRLYSAVRPQADYRRSLDLLSRAKKLLPAGKTKSGMMVGLGEEKDEVIKSLRDLRAVGCDIVTIGQYLSPSKKHSPISRYYHPDEFSELKEIALGLGFVHVESAPLVRSSYHAETVSGKRKAVSG